MRPPRTVVYIPDASRAELYLGLGKLVEVGMPVHQALANLPHGAKRRLAKVIKATADALAKGRPLAKAARHDGWLGRLDYLLLNAGEISGNLVPVLADLAADYTARASRQQRLRGKMLMPVFVLVVGVLLAPLPALISGTLTTGGYAFQALLPLVIVAAAIAASASAYRAWQLEGAPRWWWQFVALVPGAGAVAERAAYTRYLETLAMFLRSGLPALDALRECANCVTRAQLARSAKLAFTRASEGVMVAEALKGSGVMLDAADFAIVSTGEHAGRLDGALGNLASQYRNELDQTFDLIADWIPKLVYALIVAYLVVGFFS